MIVPELLCEHGTIKPLAQQVLQVARFDFDLSTVILKSKSTNFRSDPKCSTLCIFPFLRVVILNVTETFKARERCASLDEIQREAQAVSRAMNCVHSIASMCAFFSLVLLYVSHLSLWSQLFFLGGRSLYSQVWKHEQPLISIECDSGINAHFS